MKTHLILRIRDHDIDFFPPEGATDYDSATVPVLLGTQTQ